MKSCSGLDSVAAGSWLDARREDEGPDREDEGPDREDEGPGREDEGSGSGELSRPAAINNKIVCKWKQDLGLTL